MCECGTDSQQVCCHNNPNVSFFALDALRQLAMNFLEKEELSHFRFQKDFLRPFEYTIINNKNADAREMASHILTHLSPFSNNTTTVLNSEGCKKLS